VIDREDKKAHLYEQKLWEIAGRTFNPRSPQQVKVIFHELAAKTGIEKMRVSSTGVDIIKYIKHPFAKTLLAYRKSYKLVSTYGIKLIEKMEDDGRIHCNYNQYGAGTGRFASSKPNMQNIPGKKEFRRTFVASDGYLFATIDYSQIELRLAGIVSGEPEILAEYRKANADLHRLTASKIYRCAPEDITKEQRDHGKTGNFSSLYGTSARGMSTKQNIPYALARQIVKGFWAGYPVLRAYKNKVASDSVKSGFSMTPLGRIRYLNKPAYNDPAYGYKLSSMKREAFNMVIQGFAADIMKYSMVRLFDELGDRGRILLQVHDELGVEVREDGAEETVQLIVESMEKSAEIMVNNILPMTVSAELLDSWTK
jgi:DNA polymerase-1